MKMARCLKKIGVIALYSFLIVLSLHLTVKLNGRITSATLSGEIAHAMDSNVHIHVEYNPKESFVRCVDKENFPYVHFVTFTAIQFDKLYNGTDPIYVYMIAKDEDSGDVKHHLVNLTEAGLDLKSLDRDLTGSTHELTGKPLVNDPFRYAKGFWGVIDVVTWTRIILGLHDMYNGRDAPNNNLGPIVDSIEITGNKNPVVVAVKTWTYEDGIDNRNFELDSWSLWSMEVLEQNEVSIKLNLDNARVEREGILKHLATGGKISDLVPKAGEHFTDDYGDFVVPETFDPATGKGRKYETDIMSIMKDLAEGRIVDPNTHQLLTELGGGNGPDWLEGAAAMAYNGPPKEFTKCVWKISVHDGPWGGCVYPSTAYGVHLNPFFKCYRYDTTGGSYGVMALNARGYLLDHECKHSHEHLPGENVRDEEDGTNKINDVLFDDPYHHYALDSRWRGFLKPRWWSLTNVARWKNGFDGDNVMHPYYRYVLDSDGYYDKLPIGMFLTKIELTFAEKYKIFVSQDGYVKKPTDIPDDILSRYDHEMEGSFGDKWQGLIKCTVLKVLLYRENNLIPLDEYVVKYKGSEENNKDFIGIIEEPAIPVSVHPDGVHWFNYGYCVPKKYTFAISPYYDHPDNSPTAEECYFSLRGLNPFGAEPYDLYVLYQIEYEHVVREHDAAVHGAEYGE